MGFLFIRPLSFFFWGTAAVVQGCSGFFLLEGLRAVSERFESPVAWMRRWHHWGFQVGLCLRGEDQERISK